MTDPLANSLALEPFYQCVLGLRRGETGRANESLDRLIGWLDASLRNADQAMQQRIAPLVGQMLSAKQRGDVVTLADIIEHELPVVLGHESPERSLMNTALLSELARLDPLLEQPSLFTRLQEELDDLARDHDDTAGISAYHGAKCLVSGRLQDAESLLRIDEDRGTGTSDTAFMLAVCIAESGETAGAEARMGRAYDRDVTLRDGYCRISDARLRIGDIAGALSSAEKDLASDRITPPRRLDVAELAMRAGQTKEAIALVERAYADDSGLRDGFVRVAQHASAERQWVLAFELAKRDDFHGRLSANGKGVLANLYGRLGEFDRAADLIDQAYAESPAPQNAFAWLGSILAESQQWQRALAYARRDLDASRLTPDHKLFVAELCLHTGEVDTAMSLVEQAYREDPALRDGYLRLALIAIDARDWPLALTLAQADQETGRLSLGSFGVLAQILGQHGDFDTAVELIETAYAGDPNPQNSFAWLAWVKADKQDWQGALDLAKRDVEANRLMPEWKTHAAVIYAQCDLDTEAERLVSEAYAEDTGLRDGFSRLAEVKIQHKDYASAVEYVERDLALGRLADAGENVRKHLRAFQVARASEHDTPRAEAEQTYLAMQRAHYASLANRSAYDTDNRYKTSNTDELIVGSYADHAGFPYEPLLLPADLDTRNLAALDYGCGPGRMIERMAPRFRQIDGVDINEDVLRVAEANCRSLPFSPRLILTDGSSIPGVAENSYDLVYSVICLQHICVYAIRRQIFGDIYRVLAPGGLLTFQMGYGIGHRAEIDYYENRTGADATNGFFDTMVLHPYDLVGDLARIGFRKFSYTLTPTGPGDTHAAWIFMQAWKTAQDDVSINHAGNDIDPVALADDQLNFRMRLFNNGLPADTARWRREMSGTPATSG